MYIMISVQGVGETIYVVKCNVLDTKGRRVCVFGKGEVLYTYNLLLSFNR